MESVGTPSSNNLTKTTACEYACSSSQTDASSLCAFLKGRRRHVYVRVFCRSVPSGRVGLTREATFRSNDQFREAVASREMQDIQELESKLQRK